MAADTIVTGSKLTAIANAIRTKLGTQATYTLDQMATAIAGITSGDRLKSRIAKSGNNATYDYDLVGSDFPAEGISAFAFYEDYHVRDVTMPADNANITAITSTMFLGSHLRSLTLPARTDGEAWCMTSQSLMSGSSSIDGKWFANCYNLVSVDLSQVASVTRYNNSSGMFSGCSHLTSVLLPASATFNPLSQDFGSCTALASITLPDGATVSSSANASGLFRGCTALKVADLGTGVSALNGSTYGSGSFSGCTAIERIVLRKSDSMVTLSSPGYLFSTSTANIIPSSLEGIYVPDSFVATYKADTYWGIWSDYVKPISGLPGS